MFRFRSVIKGAAPELMKGQNVSKVQVFQPFLPTLRTALSKGDEKTAVACGKITSKLEEYAVTLGLPPDELRVIDVCTAGGDIHPRLHAFIGDLPRGRRQSEQRWKKGKEEDVSHIRRAISVVVGHLTGRKSRDPREGKPRRLALLERPAADPVLTPIYDSLPREVIKPTVGKQRLAETPSEIGTVIYFACAEVVGRHTVESPQALFKEHRGELRRIIRSNLPLDRVDRTDSVLCRVARKFDATSPKKKALTAEEFPSPLREELKVFREAVDGRISGAARIAAAAHGLELKDRISWFTYDSSVTVIARLVSAHPGYERLGVRDLLETSVTVEADEAGRQHAVYFNKFLTPLREAERGRESSAKEAGKDSVTFVKTLTAIKSVAAYNGILEYHKIIGEAFKPHTDRRTKRARKAEKKAALDRRKLNEWIENNWQVFESIVKKESFKRDRSKRHHPDSDRNMHFVLYYVAFVVMCVMGYRQRQMRDCVAGVNLKVTATSVELTFAEDQTKKGTPLHFFADLKTTGRTHGRLIHTLHLYMRHVFPYIQQNLAPWEAPDEKDRARYDPKGQVFVTQDRAGKFRRFKFYDAADFATWFKRATKTFLRDKELVRDAILLLHPHHMRGAAMDTMVIDHGMSEEGAGNYFGVSSEIVKREYKDRNAVRDASRDVVLINKQMAELEEITEGKRGSEQVAEIRRLYEGMIQNFKDGLERSEAEKRDLQARLEAVEAEKAGLNLQIVGLRREVDDMRSRADARHDELMKAITGKSGAAQSPPRSNSKARKAQHAG